MGNVLAFLAANNVTQKELAEYFGVKPPAINQLVKNDKDFPKVREAQLLNNDRGWDTSMLGRTVTVKEAHITNSGGAVAIGGDASVENSASKEVLEMYLAQIRELREQLKEEKARNKVLTKIIANMSGK